MPIQKKPTSKASKAKTTRKKGEPLTDQDLKGVSGGRKTTSDDWTVGARAGKKPPAGR